MRITVVTDYDRESVAVFLNEKDIIYVGDPNFIDIASLVRRLCESLNVKVTIVGTGTYGRPHEYFDLGRTDCE